MGIRVGVGEGVEEGVEVEVREFRAHLFLSLLRIRQREDGRELCLLPPLPPL
jgi:hypothetical protein